MLKKVSLLWKGHRKFDFFRSQFSRNVVEMSYVLIYYLISYDIKTSLLKFQAKYNVRILISEFHFFTLK